MGISVYNLTLRHCEKFIKNDLSCLYTPATLLLYIMRSFLASLNGITYSFTTFTYIFVFYLLTTFIFYIFTHLKLI